MKNIKKLLPVVFAAFMLSACNDFDDINTNPRAANVDQVEVEYVLNNAIIQAQMDPHIAERVFVLYWKGTGRQTFGAWEAYVVDGSYNDGFSSDYFGGGYLSKWLNLANLAVRIAEEKIATETDKDYTLNLMQVARIWRAYLMSELADNFGPMPVDGFQGTAPEYSDVETVYRYLLAELKDAAAKIDLTVVNTDASFTKFDPAYGYDFAKWQKYANSLRMRLAMRLSEVDAATAKTEFEDAARGALILEADEMFAVKEKDGWDPLTGVMTRGWNYQMLSSTANNIFIGLGGVATADVKPEYAEYTKPSDWAGVKYERHMTNYTNDPSKGFWFDGLYDVIDPRAYSIYTAPGETGHNNYNAAALGGFKMLGPDADSDADDITETHVAFTWNGGQAGNLGTLMSSNEAYATAPYYYPSLSRQFRTSTSSRVFFAAWETYFLLAEASVRGWSTPVDGKTAYENGIKASFDYWGLGAHVDTYLASEDYNRVGTSVNWDHIAEATPVTMDYKDGYTGATVTDGFTWTPPVNTIYKGGVNNDKLNKIITQKFIANNPWLPLEVWNDHRRLGLPFFENPSVEQPMLSMPTLNQGNSTSGNQLSFFPQRLKYPSGLQTSNAEGYQQAVGHLGAGGDDMFTPLWWAQH